MRKISDKEVRKVWDEEEWKFSEEESVPRRCGLREEEVEQGQGTFTCSIVTATVTAAVGGRSFLFSQRVCEWGVGVCSRTIRGVQRRGPD